MHHKGDRLRTDPWESALGDDSSTNHSEIIALNHHNGTLQPDSDIRRKFRRRIVKNPHKHTYPPIQGRVLESIVLQPGGHREAHLHPNTAQVDFVVSGEARIGILGQADEVEIRYAYEGEVAFIPMGCGHWIENMSDTAPLLVLVLANEEA
jgi:mannose-6-phosphate isomerase-like protein (cupin superfamily)